MLIYWTYLVFCKDIKKFKQKTKRLKVEMFDP